MNVNDGHGRHHGGWSGRNGGGNGRATRLYRDPERGRLAGVCAGIADYFGLEPALVRVFAVIGLVFFTVPTLVLYGLAAAFVPRRPRTLYADPAEAAFWRGVRTEPVGTVRELSKRFERIDRRLQSLEACVTSSEFKLHRDIRDLR